MEPSTNDKREQEIVFSRAIKTGKRIYYLDVKRTRTDEPVEDKEEEKPRSKFDFHMDFDM